MDPIAVASAQRLTDLRCDFAFEQAGEYAASVGFSNLRALFGGAPMQWPLYSLCASKPVAVTKAVAVVGMAFVSYVAQSES
jgi:hypothetical protein